MDAVPILIWDETDARELQSSLLSHSCMVQTTSSWEEFCAQISAETCDVAVVRGGRTELIESAQAQRILNTPRKHVMIVALASGLTAAEQEKLILNGFDDVLHAPDFFGHLASQLKAVSRVAAMRRELMRRQATLQTFMSVIESDRFSLNFVALSENEVSRHANLLFVDLTQADPEAARIFGTLRARSRATYVNSIERAQEILFTNAIDISIIHIGSNADAGLNLCFDLRNSVRFYNHPILMIDTRPTPMDGTSAYHAGINDYLTAPLAIDDIEARVRALLRHERLRRSLADECETSYEHVVRDGLTGLYTRGFGLTHLNNLYNNLHGRPMSVSICQIDNLRDINRNFGYIAGDFVVRQTAETIRQCLRGEDLAARYSGTKFLIIFPETNLENAQKALSRLDSSLRYASYTIPQTDQIIVPHISHAVLEWDEGQSLEQLLSLLNVQTAQAA